jgi:hypothetical protein
MPSQFRCKCCAKTREGIPAYHADRPAQYWDVPENRLESDVFLTSDSCVIADQFFFIHGCIEIPVIGAEQPFVWGVWVSLKEENFFTWQDHYVRSKRSHIGPFFGWLSTVLPVYPNTLLLKTSVHLRDDGVRPMIVLERTEHPLTIEQSDGITLDRVMQIIHQVEDVDTQ